MYRANCLVAGMATMILMVLQTALIMAAASAPAQTSAAHASLPDPADLAALLTTLGPLAGWTLEKTVGTVAPFKMSGGAGVELSFPPEKPAADKSVPLTLWIMAGDYSAAAAAPMTRPGTPIAGMPRELDRWNGCRVFIFDGGDKGWPNAEADIQRALRVTSGPLAASVVVGNVDNKEMVEFEIKNRSKEAVNVCAPYRGVPSIDLGWAVYGVDFMMIGGRGGGSVLNHAITVLKPGETLRWPLTELPNIAAGTTAKVDCSYQGISAAEGQEFVAKGLTVWVGGVIAPAVRVSVDKAGKTTVSPWSPAALTPAEEEASLRVAAGMDAWMKQLKRDLAAIPPGGAAGDPIFDLQRDSHDVPRYVLGTLALNCNISALGDQPMPFAPDLPALAVKVTATREGEWRGLALASDADKITWDGKALRRAIRVAGTDWVVTLAAQSNRPELLQRASALLDDAFNRLARLATDSLAPVGQLPAVPATVPGR